MVLLTMTLQHASKENKYPIMHLDKCEMFLHTKNFFLIPECKLLVEIRTPLMTSQPAK